MPVQQHSCQCPHCLGLGDSPQKEHHRQVNLLWAFLNRRQRRLYAAVESNRIGRGGVRMVSWMTGICPASINRGRRELKSLLEGNPLPQTKPSGGRPRTEIRFPAVAGALEEMLADETAGDPMGEQKWVRSSVANLAHRLRERNCKISSITVWRILKRMGFSMKTNLRKRRGYKPNSPQRDEQFKYIASLRKEFGAAGLPIISVDTKKKELIGDFMNQGRAWRRDPHEVNEHDFPSAAQCRAVPFGVYDVTRNAGYVVVGISRDTPAFAVKAITKWWKEVGRSAHPRAKKLLILADCGGTNGYRSKAWKINVQERLCDKLRLVVTVCHYPAGCSKWNPIERRLFSQISINWAGKPLRTLGTMLGYIRGTTTRTGLEVKAFLDEGVYERGHKIMREDMEHLNLKPHAICGQWNYTLHPRP